jgi:hypothetical protein
LICLAIGLMSCRSENNAAFYAGGKMTVNLPQGEKLEQVSWKADQRVVVSVCGILQRNEMLQNHQKLMFFLKNLSMMKFKELWYFKNNK